MDGKGLRALLCVLVVVGCLFASAPLAVPGAAAEAGNGGPNALAQQDGGQSQAQTQRLQGNGSGQEGSDRLNDASEIHIDVFVYENGSATFVVDYRFENDSSGEWAALREDIEANNAAYVADEMAAWNKTLEDSENATDREMHLEDGAIETDTSSQPQNLGHVQVSFEWINFAYVELNRIEISDVLTGIVLSQDTTMEVYPPDGYVISEDESSTESGDGSVFWQGDSTDFTADPPTVVMIENGDVQNESANATANASAAGDRGPPMRWSIVAAALALLVVAGAAGWWVRDRGILGPGPAPEAGGGRGGGPPPAEGAANGGEAKSNGPPPELLSNEERVLRLLEQRGGRIKQQEVVSELDWTEAKTSQVVSGLREDGEIEVFRIGRENVLSLPDEGERGNRDVPSGSGSDSPSDPEPGVENE
ncbi:helix-turn-helix transcriptional regulator [Halopiger thermotolerans]